MLNSNFAVTGLKSDSQGPDQINGKGELTDTRFSPGINPDCFKEIRL